MGDLTDREEEVIQLMAEGLATKTIAERLWVTVATVRNHIQNIFTKLEVHNRIQAVVAWKEHRADPSERVLAYCRRARIPVTDLQVELIRAAFSAHEVSCESPSHVFPDGADQCLCGRIRVS